MLKARARKCYDFKFRQAVTMLIARARKCYDFKFRQAVIQKKTVTEKELGNIQLMKLQILLEGGFYLLFFHLNYGFYLRVTSIRGRFQFEKIRYVSKFRRPAEIVIIAN